MVTRGRFSQKNGLNGNGGGGGAGDIVAGGGYTLGRSTCRPNFLVNSYNYVISWSLDKAWLVYANELVVWL